MKPEANKKRIKEIREVYRSLGLNSRELLEHFAAFRTVPSYTDEEKKVVFIKAGTTSLSNEGE